MAASCPTTHSSLTNGRSFKRPCFGVAKCEARSSPSIDSACSWTSDSIPAALPYSKESGITHMAFDDQI